MAKWIAMAMLVWALSLAALAGCAQEHPALTDPEAQLIQALGDAGASGDLARTVMFMRAPTQTVQLDANRLQALNAMQSAVLEHKQQAQAAAQDSAMEMQANRLAAWQQAAIVLAVAAVAAVLILAGRDVAVAVVSRPSRPAPPVLLVNFAAMLEAQGHAVEVEEVDGQWWAFDDTAMVRYNADDARSRLTAPRLGVRGGPTC